ncbi:MAG: O-antigen ligase family protein [Verrucomicrobia bacterium]|nr:O-antigen ligase family protein [Verrucomicrobiota bacterium]
MIAALVAVLVVATLAFGAVTIDMGGLVYGLGILLLCLWALKLALARSVSWKASPLHYPVAAFALYATLRYFTCPIEYGARLELFMVLLCTMIYFAAAANFYHQRDRAILLHSLVALALVESGYAFWQFYVHADKVLHLVRPETYQHRGSGTFWCPNHFAGFISMVLGLVLAYVAVRRPRRSDVERSALSKVYLAYAGLVLLVGLLVSLSRGAWLATAAGVLVVLLWGDWRQRAMWPRIAVAVLAIVGLVVIATRVDTVRDYIRLTFTAQNPGQTSTLRDPTLGGRTQLWKATLSMIADRPVFGGGPATWQWYHLKYRHPAIQRQPEFAHNDFLNLAADYGLVGLAIGLAIVGCFYWQAILMTRSPASSDQRAFAIGSLVAVTILLLHSWIDFNLHIPSNALLAATLLGCTAAMEDPRKRFPRAEIGRGTRRTLAAGLVAFCLVSGWHVARAAISHRFVVLGIESKMGFRNDAAFLAFHRAIAADPGNPEPRFQIANVFANYSRFLKDPSQAEERSKFIDAAITRYHEVLALQPMNSMVMLRLAIVYERAKDHAKALDTYLRALELDPNCAEILLRLGQFYMRTGETEKAEAALKRSRAISDGPNLSADLILWEMAQPPEQPPATPPAPPPAQPSNSTPAQPAASVPE